MLYVLSWSCSRESEAWEDDQVPGLRQVWVLSFTKERIQEQDIVKWRKVYSERNTSHRYSVGPLGKHQCIWAYEFLRIYMLSSVQLFVNPMDCSPPGSSVHRILQSRVLEWVTMLSSSGSSRLKDRLRPPELQVDSLLSEPPGKPSLYLGTIQTETVLINIFISYNIESHVSLDYTPSIN